MTWTNRTALAVGLVGAVALQSRPALAQNEAATARTLFNEARALASKGQYDDACPKFEESFKLRPGEGTRFNLADCWEHVGKTASAWAEYLEVASSAKVAGRKDREQLARKRADALEPRLSKLVIRVPADEAGIIVKRDGNPVGESTWGTPVPIDPGNHTIEAGAPGKSTWTEEVKVSGTEPVVVEIPSLGGGSGEERRGKRKKKKHEDEDHEQGASSATSATISSDSVSNAGGGRTLAYVAAGAGAGFVLLGTIFYLDFKSKNDKAASICQDSVCAQSEIDRHNGLVDDAQRARTLSYLNFGAAALAFGTGAVLYVTSDSPSVARRDLELAPAVGPGLAGLSARGSF